MEKTNVMLYDREFRINKRIRKDDRGKWTISLNLRPYRVHASKAYPRYYYFNNSEISRLVISYINLNGYVTKKQHENLSWQQAKAVIIKHLIT